MISSLYDSHINTTHLRVTLRVLEMVLFLRTMISYAVNKLSDVKNDTTLCHGQAWQG